MPTLKFCHKVSAQNVLDFGTFWILEAKLVILGLILKKKIPLKPFGPKHYGSRLFNLYSC